MLTEEQFVIGEDDGSVKLMDIEKNKEIITIELKSITSNFVLEKISTTQVAAYEKPSYYLEIVDFNALQGKNITLFKNKDLVTCIKSLVLGESFAMGFSNGLLKIYNYKEKVFIQKIDCNVEKINVDMSIECIDCLNQLIVVGGLSGFIHVWNWKSGGQVSIIKKIFTNDDYTNKNNDINKGRCINRVLFLNEKEILSQGETENSYQFYSLTHENQQLYPLFHYNVIRFLQPSDYQSIIVKKPVFTLPLDFESFSVEYSRDNILFIQKDYRKIGRYLQIYNHSTNKLKFQHYFERNSQIVGAYLTSKHLVIVYSDGVIEGYA